MLHHIICVHYITLFIQLLLLHASLKIRSIFNIVCFSAKTFSKIYVLVQEVSLTWTINSDVNLILSLLIY